MFFQRATAHALSRWRFYGPVASVTLLALVAAILLLANHVASTTPDGTWLWQSSDNAQALYLDINGQSGEASYVTYDQVANRANPTNDTLVVTPDRELEFDMQGFPACGTGCPYALRNGLLVLAVIGSPSITLRPATQSQFDGVVADLQSKVHSTTAAAQQAQQTVQSTQQNEQNLCVGKYGGELAVDQPVCSINIDGGTWTVVFDSTGHPTTDPCADDHWATAHGMASGTFTPGAYNEGCQLPTLSVDQAQSDCTSGSYFPAEIAPPFGGKATTYGPPFTWHADLFLCTAQVGAS